MTTDFSEQPWILVGGPDELCEQDCACADSGVAPAALVDDGVELAETDCACADVRLTPRQSLVEAEDTLWRISPDLYSAPLPERCSVALSVNGPAGLVVLNEPARRILEAHNQPGRLRSPMAQRLARLGLLEPCDRPRRGPQNSPTTLTAWLHVTNACNLRCTYCYVDKTDEAMDEATGRAAVDAVLRSATRNGFGAVKLKYAGGESTLNFALVRVLHQYATQQASENALALHEVILSNGVGLTRTMLDFIRDANMRLMISIDGLGADHDTQRIFFNGRGSSRHVARSIDRAIAQGVKPHLSITVTRHNAASIAAAVAFALDRDLLFNLNFYRDHNTGATHQELAAEDADLITGVRAAFRVIEERLPSHSLMAALVDRSNFTTPHDRPCGAGHSYIVIDQHGRVSGCQMEIERSVTDVMAQDPLEVIRLQPAGFKNVSVDEKEGCRGCQWRYRCAGGCPLLTYRVTGRSDVKSPYCHMYKALFPDLLRLEGLRLMKWTAVESQ